VLKNPDSWLRKWPGLDHQRHHEPQPLICRDFNGRERKIAAKPIAFLFDFYVVLRNEDWRRIEQTV
jgi:hypothetical protein